MKFRQVLLFFLVFIITMASCFTSLAAETTESLSCSSSEGGGDSISKGASEILSQCFISGKLCRPNEDAADEDLIVDISTSAASVSVTIPKGEYDADYVVASNVNCDEYIKVEVLTTDLYMSGYFDGYEFIDYENPYTYITESLNDVDITLKKQCLISGGIILPQSVIMADKTYFTVYIEIKNTENRFITSQNVYVYSDKDNKFKCSVPYEYRDESFTISYDYGRYESRDFPSASENPLKYLLKRPSSGGGGGGADLLPGYEFEEPSGLFYDYLIYLNDEGGTVEKDNAVQYSFTDNLLNTDINLSPEGSIAIFNSVGGYFTSVFLNEGTDVEIQLIDYSNNSIVDTRSIKNANGSYRFNDIAYGTYIIGAKYGGKQYYYTGNRLSETISYAKLIHIYYTEVNYGNDMYFDNIFPVNVSCKIDKCVIDGQTADNTVIKIYDIYGRQQNTYSCSEEIRINFTPFVIGINDKYVSNCEMSDYVYINEVTNDFFGAEKIYSDYIDSLTYQLAVYPYPYNLIRINLGGQFDYLISDIFFEDGYTVAGVSKNVESSNTDRIYFAVYTDGILTDLVCDNIVEMNGTEYIASSRTLNVSPNDIVKVFIWNDVNKPLSLVKETVY